MTKDERRNYDQYLARYAEAEARHLQAALSGGYQLPAGRAVASIPLCQELALIEGCLESLRLAAAQHPAIVIFIVNNRASAPELVKDSNIQTLNYLKSQMTAGEGVGNIFLGPVSPDLFLLVVDRTSADNELPEQQGVGMARKIGCDLGAVIIAETVTLDVFIRNTDGDARVGRDYFAAIKPEQPKVSAAIYPFHHEPKSDGVDAVLQYELYLHYYVRAMKFAGSSFAFHTIGSTIACEANAYISCRGFPKRDAGEDFYLLNKLAKVGAVETLLREPVVLVARDSDRVPFGTGAACRRIEGLVLNGGTYQVYHPDCFRLLKIWLDTLSVGVLESRLEVWDSFVECSIEAFPGLNRELLDSVDQALSLQEGFKNVLEKSPRKEVRLQHAQIWFDGFRTMRFLNLARDHCFGETPAATVSELFL